MIHQYSPMKIVLDSGRVLRVDMLMFESTLVPLDFEAYNCKQLPMLARRSWMDWSEGTWIDLDQIHFMVDEYEDNAMDSNARFLATALLYSDPVSSDYGFSELLVVTYLHWQGNWDVQLILQKTLRGIDWENLAVDRPLHVNPEIVDFKQTN